MTLALPVLRLRQAMVPEPRVSLRANGRIWRLWTAVEIHRDLQDLAAGFRVECFDVARARQALAGEPLRRSDIPALRRGDLVELAIDEEPVLIGRIDTVELDLDGERLACAISGRDHSGHLVDCAAAPKGPAEYRNLTLLQFAQAICLPFGIPVRADVDVGAPFPLIGIECAEKALPAIEKLARQREILVTSDGIGGLVLTRGGISPAPAPLRLGETIWRIRSADSILDCYSDVWVKGQSTAQRGSTAPLDAKAATLTATAPATTPTTASAPAKDRATVVMTGHARDPEITWYRPCVHAARTQSGGSTVQQQADWMVRVARGKAASATYTALDFRAGPDWALWRPNASVLVDDPFTDVFEERLIHAVTYRYGEDGAMTELGVTRHGAFDLEPEEALRAAKRKRGQGRKKATAAQDATAQPLTGS